MMKKYAAVVISLLIFMMFAACERAEVSPQTFSDGSKHYPWLKPGHELHYAYSNSGDDDSMIIRILSSPSPGTYRAEISYQPSGRSNILYYHAVDKNLYTSTNGNYLQYERWWFSLNARVGDFWSRSTPGILFTYQLEGKDVTVQTSNLQQIFIRCYQVSAKNPFGNGIDMIYFRPDAGIVYYHGVDGQYELVYKNFNVPLP